jgi:ferredoxin
MNTPKKISKVIVDKNKCIGAATCVVIAAKAFELNSKGLSEVKTSWTEQSEDELLQAARSCPTQAISLLDKEGNEIKLF